jgi:hypothetical protein
MSKLCATELRTSPNGANFEFTGDDGDLTSMNIDHIRELARKLADRSGQRVNALDAEGSRAYEQLSTILQRYRDTGQPYQEIYEVIITEFANVTAINPGTVADKFLSCHRSTGCGANECNPACINSIMKRPGDVVNLLFKELEFTIHPLLSSISMARVNSLRSWLKSSSDQASIKSQSIE